jgi:hypothetical protein
MVPSPPSRAFISILSISSFSMTSFLVSISLRYFYVTVLISLFFFSSKARNFLSISFSIYCSFMTFYCLASINSNSLVISMFSRTSNFLTFPSNSSSLMLLFVLYYYNLIRSFSLFRRSSFNRSMTFSEAAKLCCVNVSSCLITFSRLLASESYSQRHEFEVSSFFRLAISRSYLSFISTSLVFHRYLIFLMTSCSLEISCLAPISDPCKSEIAFSVISPAPGTAVFDGD